MIAGAQNQALIGTTTTCLPAGRLKIANERVPYIYVLAVMAWATLYTLNIKQKPDCSTSKIH
jgi:hypothetical protein